MKLAKHLPNSLFCVVTVVVIAVGWLRELQTCTNILLADLRARVALVRGCTCTCCTCSVAASIHAKISSWLRGRECARLARVRRCKCMICATKKTWLFSPTWFHLDATNLWSIWAFECEPKKNKNWFLPAWSPFSRDRASTAAALAEVSSSATHTR